MTDEITQAEDLDQAEDEADDDDKPSTTAASLAELETFVLGVDALLDDLHAAGKLNTDEIRGFRAACRPHVASLSMLLQSMDNYLREGLVIPSSLAGGSRIVVPPPGGFHRG